MSQQFTGSAYFSNRVAGLLAALLLGLSEYHIWYSQEARTYALLALSGTLFAAASVQYLRRPTLACAFWAVLNGVALLYSHAYGALTWFSISAAVLAIILLAPVRVLTTGSNWLLIQVLTVGAFLPWAIIVLQRPFGGWVALGLQKASGYQTYSCSGYQKKTEYCVGYTNRLRFATELRDSTLY